MIFAERWSRKTGQFFPKPRKYEGNSTRLLIKPWQLLGSSDMVFFKFLCRKICYLLDLLASPVRLPHSVSLARPQPSAPSSILDAVQHAATQERCASRRRSSVRIRNSTSVKSQCSKNHLCEITVCENQRFRKSTSMKSTFVKINLNEISVFEIPPQ